MSYKEYSQMNYINERQQMADCQIDNDQYFLFNTQNYQNETPKGDELCINNLNNSFSNELNDYMVLNTNIDNDSGNEFAAAPVPLNRELHPEISLNENYFEKSEFGEDSNNFIPNDISCSAPSILEKEKEKENGKEQDIINDTDKSKENQNVITPFPETEENGISKNQNVNEAPINNANNLANSSSSQKTNISIFTEPLICQENANQVNALQENDSHLQNLSQTFNPDKTNEQTKETVKDNENCSKKSKKKNSLTRKYKPDHIRKKIKARLHKKLGKIINKRLKECGSKMFFDYLPQPFITDVNMVKNKAYLNLSMRTIIKMYFGNKAKDREKVKTNIRVLNYLDSNDKIRIESGVDDFLNSTYEDIIEYYINGKLFEGDIKKLRQENEPKEYVDKYIFLGKNWIRFYKEGKI